MLHDAQSLSATQIHTLLNQIRSSSDDLMTMVNDILDVSKIEAGKFVLTKTTARLQDTITAVCTYYETLFKLRKIILVLDIQSDMPELSFDPDRIRQVLNNLLSNALKFTPENGTVTVSAHRIDHYVEVSVSDTGPGVASKDKPLLFHKFIQGSNHSATSEKGTGLGLVIVKSIVEAHGGRIWIDDNKPTGAKFIFSLPL
jgi:signal transduction histidine kinase